MGKEGFFGPICHFHHAIPTAWSSFEGELRPRAYDLTALANDFSLRNLIPADLAKGFGFFQSKPASAFSPMAVTPDELGDAWHETTVHLPLEVPLNAAQRLRRHRSGGTALRSGMRLDLSGSPVCSPL
jgi:hypothetical protein